MVRAIIHSCNGAMGQVFGIAAKDEISIVAGIDRTEQKMIIRFCVLMNECKVEADVVIDFPMQLSMNFSTGVREENTGCFVYDRTFRVQLAKVEDVEDSCSSLCKHVLLVSICS